MSDLARTKPCYYRVEGNQLDKSWRDCAYVGIVIGSWRIRSCLEHRSLRCIVLVGGKLGLLPLWTLINQECTLCSIPKFHFFLIMSEPHFFHLLRLSQSDKSCIEMARCPSPKRIKPRQPQGATKKNDQSTPQWRKDSEQSQSSFHLLCLPTEIRYIIWEFAIGYIPSGFTERSGL